MKKLLIFSVILALNCCYAQEATNYNSSLDDDAVYINKNLKVMPQKIVEKSQEQRYSIEATFPQLQGNHLSAEAKAFNQGIQQLVQKNITQFKQDVLQDAPHMQTLPLEVRNNYLHIDYDIDVIQPTHQELISVRLAIESMLAGRAHPFHSHQVYNFDLTHGKELALSDLFKNHTDYLSFLAQYSQKQLQQSLPDKWMVQDGTKPLPKNFKNWNIEADAILITFDEYQVAPYTYGPQEIEIPYSELRQILSRQATVISQSKDPMHYVG